jgi:hypothetical protein
LDEVDEAAVAMPNRMLHTRKDGNCAFESLSTVLTGHPEAGHCIRASIADFEEQNQEIFEPIFGEKFPRHVEELRNKRTWATEIELIAACLLFEMRLWIFQAQYQRWIVYIGGDTGDTFLHLERQHFTVVLDMTRPVTANNLHGSESAISTTDVTQQQPQPDDAAPQESQSGDEAPQQSQSGDAAPQRSQSGDAAPQQSQSGDEAPQQSQSDDAAPQQSQSDDEASQQSQSGDAAPQQSQSDDEAQQQSQSDDEAQQQSQSGDEASHQSQSGGAASQQPQSDGKRSLINI